MQSESKKLIMVSIIAFVIGFLVAWLIWGNTSAPTENQEETTNPTTTNNEALDSVNNVPQASGGSSLSVLDQAPGKTINVLSASLDGAAWIVIREMIEGAPGNILGAQYVENSGENLSVELLRGTVEGGSYQALLFRDNGDRLFDHLIDSPIVETEIEFTTTVTPAE